jgi:DNA repair protein RadC
MRVADLPTDERPREKLLRQGAGSLTDVELVAVLLRTGTHGTPVLELARSLLDESGGLAALAATEVRALIRRKGVGLAKGAVVAAALELGRRLAKRALVERPLLDRPEVVAEYLGVTHSHERIEVFGCITLDARHRLEGVHVLHRGGRAHAHVEPSEIFNRAIVDNAHGVILWHTHPSGDPTASSDDLDLTNRLASAGRLLGIAVLDHIILGQGRFVSLRQRGLMPAQ